ncbi:MAG: DUF1800 domain-containing protein, partial [Caulobacteraceae bacterium]
HDLLLASSRNPAMLIYLDQAQSIGPDSAAARFRDFRGKKAAGLNENLGREMMELHTVGVEAGYSQADVTEFSKALTGWSIGGLNEPDAAGRFVFRPRAHEPGARTIMAKRYAEGGEDQALAVMADLAASPHTAHHLGFELARHFVADDPPPSLVEKLKRTYLASGGDLSEVARTLIKSPESWEAPQKKFKRPYEFMVSSWRAAGWTKGDLLASPRMLTAMGQKPFSAPSPKGWPEAAQDWAAPDDIVKRMAWSEDLASRQGAGRDPMVLADAALGARLSPQAAQAISRAETRVEGLAILLMSPEFQRR